jgi:hypothetical protein
MLRLNEFCPQGDGIEQIAPALPHWGRRVRSPQRLNFGLDWHGIRGTIAAKPLAAPIVPVAGGGRPAGPQQAFHGTEARQNFFDLYTEKMEEWAEGASPAHNPKLAH